MIGKALRLTREFHRMKQVELAKRLNISTSYLSEIERERKPPSIEILDSYAEIFRIPASTFFLFKERTLGSDDPKQKERAGKLLKFFEWVTSEESDGDAQEEETSAPGTSEETVPPQSVRAIRH